MTSRQPDKRRTDQIPRGRLSLGHVSEPKRSMTTSERAIALAAQPDAPPPSRRMAARRFAGTAPNFSEIDDHLVIGACSLRS